jgi:hypothetical protein
MNFRHQRRRLSAHRVDQRCHVGQPGRVVAGGSA